MGRHDTHDVDRQLRGDGGHLNSRDSEELQQRQQDANDHELADLHTDVEEKKGNRPGLVGQSDLRKCPREAKPVQESESKGDQPR